MNAVAHGANRRTAIRLGLVALAMFSFGYVLAPFYDVLCRAIGLDRARPEFATAIPTALRLEFDTNVADGLPVTIDTLDRVVAAKAGSLVKARFRIANTGDQPLTIRAIPSFAPVRAAGLLQKLECFCFDALKLAPHETRDVTVVLLVAETLPEELGAATLSYTLQPA
ncbi:cytochrome c oxidase assembly protein [Jeongeupia chitinilytica]|uniref:Cytochrome c oxidase assembly protein CtaG n=1 Tax=Jeongeupia chitinilytica TaxID=1041641 RepID=A0ABQ3H4R3_9NEIS|nr:cytochrome c oxidase assembly protein [Jeongeupia chitinilytica]GHD68090.1 cytochrome c oxidase assembly protein [Jeongeupia chitinilytica]